MHLSIHARQIAQIYSKKNKTQMPSSNHLYEICEKSGVGNRGLNNSKKNLEAYIPAPSNKSSTHTLKKLLIFTEYLRLRCFQPLLSQCVAAQQCLIRQLVDQRHRRLVPLVLEPPSAQATKHFYQIATNLSHDGLNPAHVPY